MPASKPDTPRFSDKGYGETNFAKMDAREITQEEYDEIPELTDEMLARAVEHEGGAPSRRGRPKLENPKAHVSLRLDPHVLEAYRATGPGWQARINETLARGAKKLARAKKG